MAPNQSVPSNDIFVGKSISKLVKKRLPRRGEILNRYLYKCAAAPAENEPVVREEVFQECEMIWKEHGILTAKRRYKQSRLNALISFYRRVKSTYAKATEADQKKIMEYFRRKMKVVFNFGAATAVDKCPDDMRPEIEKANKDKLRFNERKYRRPQEEVETSYVSDTSGSDVSESSGEEEVEPPVVGDVGEEQLAASSSDEEEGATEDDTMAHKIKPGAVEQRSSPRHGKTEIAEIFYRRDSLENHISPPMLTRQRALKRQGGEQLLDCSAAGSSSSNWPSTSSAAPSNMPIDKARNLVFVHSASSSESTAKCSRNDNLYDHTSPKRLRLVDYSDTEEEDLEETPPPAVHSSVVNVKETNSPSSSSSSTTIYEDLKDTSSSSSSSGSILPDSSVKTIIDLSNNCPEEATRSVVDLRSKPRSSHGTRQGSTLMLPPSTSQDPAKPVVAPTNVDGSCQKTLPSANISRHHAALHKTLP